MQRSFYLLLLAFSLNACSNQSQTTNMGTSANALTDKEQRDGWQLLFDGTTTNGWHSYGKATAGKAWKAEDGTLRLDASSKKDWQTAEGGDIVSADSFGDFHLKMEWKIAPNGNSGMMFYVQEDPAKYQHSWHTGPEMQILHNEGHPDGKIIKHRAGDLYDLITAKETVRPVGEWNQVEVISKNGQLEFHMNGEKTLSTTLWNDSWNAMVAGSKFKNMPDFGKFRSGRIALQDHGDNVWFRNIKIRRL